VPVSKNGTAKRTTWKKTGLKLGGIFIRAYKVTIGFVDRLEWACVIVFLITFHFIKTSSM
jgi:hypothetical protein